MHKTLKILLPLIVLALTSCATWQGKKHDGKVSKKPTHTDTTKQGNTTKPVEKEIKKPEEQQYASISTPSRKASMTMVDKGKRLLDSGKYDEALSSFQEAVVIDGTNGIAYYYMAKTRFYLKQYQEALGILEKAESLLGQTDEWNEAIAMLRTQIETSYNQQSL